MRNEVTALHASTLLLQRTHVQVDQLKSNLNTTQVKS